MKEKKRADYKVKGSDMFLVISLTTLEVSSILISQASSTYPHGNFFQLFASCIRKIFIESVQARQITP
jgi:hypothetical protein